MASGQIGVQVGRPATLPDRVARELREIVGPDGVLDRYEDLLVYEYDGYLDRALPTVVVRPQSGAEVAAIVKVAVRERLAVVARGGASGLSGGVIPIAGGIMIDLNRMYRVLEVDVENGLALVEPALINLDLSTAVAR